VVKLLDPVIFANCDGSVALDAFAVTPEMLAVWTAAGPHRETHHYTTQSQPGCGASAEYDVTWSVVQCDPAWAGWLNLGNGFTTGSRAATACRAQLFAFAVATKNDPRGTTLQISFSASADGRGWQPWAAVPRHRLTNLSVTAIAFQDRLLLFAVGLDYKIYATAFDGQNWSGWANTGGDVTTYHPLGAATVGNRLFLFAIPRN